MGKLYLSSGEIADICNINKKTLFYYDEMDVLKPAFVKDNGYRYYTVSQIDQLSKIKALQSVGFSLEEIKKQLHMEDVSEGIAMLNLQKQKIEEKANELLAVKEALHVKIGALEHFEQVGLHTIFIKETREEWLHLEEASRQGELQANYLLDGYHFGVMLNSRDSPDGNMKMIKYRRIKDRHEGDFIKEEGPYAGIYFVSEAEQIVESAFEALAIVKSSGFSLGEELFVEDIASDFVTFQNGRIPFHLSIQIKGSYGLDIS